MSAWIVSKNHIDTLVYQAMKQRLIEPEQADATGRMLWAENLKSVAYRYPTDKDGERPGPDDFKDSDVLTYTYAEPRRLPASEYGAAFDPDDEGAVVIQVECYEYQSCEHPGYAASPARALATLLGVTLVSNGSSGAASNAPWGV